MKPLLALLALSVLLVAGCEDGSSTDTGKMPNASRSGLEGTITVSAAKSLTDAFTRIADDFSAANPNVEVKLNFDASSTLSTQIVEGSPVDVFASADDANMARLTKEGLIAGEPVVFARNVLVIVTKPGNPEGITTPADLADAGVISLCGENVPCGRYAGEVLEKADTTIDESNVTRGQNAATTLSAVSEGDATAGIVYLTDARAAGDTVEIVSIPTDVNVVATYPIGVLEESGNAEVAEAFMAYVLGAEGQAVLSDYGFLPPT